MEKEGNEAMGKERNIGIDFLRIVSMLLIVLLHVLGHGGVLAAVDLLSINYIIAWFLEIAAGCAVNCYALISGYVGVDAEFKYANIFSLWLQVVFYNVVGSVIGYICFQGDYIGKRDLVKAFFPVMYNYYWYFTAYFCMFFFIPFFNYLMQNMKRKQTRGLVITAVVLFSILPTIIYKDPFGTGNGYSALWLAALYLIGAYIKKYQIGTGEQRKKMPWIYLSCIVISWLCKLLLDYITVEKNLELITSHVDINYDGMLLVNYTSPTVLFASVALLIWFAGLKIGRSAMRKAISFLAPATFGVFLIHDQSAIRHYLIYEAFAWYGKCAPPKMILLVVTTVLTVYLLCSVIDRGRFWIFNKLGVKKLCVRLTKRMQNIMN